VGILPFGASGTMGGFGFGPATGNVDPVTGRPVVNAAFGAELSGIGRSLETPSAVDVLSARLKATLSLGKAVGVYGEAEQDLRDDDKRLAAVGGHLRLTERTKAYLRHEFLSSLGSPYALSSRQRNYSTVFGLSSTYLKGADVFSEYRLRDAIAGREAQAAMGLRNLWSLRPGVDLSASVERLHSIAGRDDEATAATMGLSHTASQRFKGSARVEWRRDASGDTWLSTLGLARKLSSDWTLLSKNYYQRTEPKRGRGDVQNRFWFGGAYRDVESNRLNLLSRYEYRFEDMRGTPALAIPAVATKRDVHAVSTHADWHPSASWTLSGQHAAKLVSDRTEGSLSRYLANLVSGRLGYDLSRRVDVGVLGSASWSPNAGGRRYGLGGELGYLLHGNVWLSIGYNLIGFSDRDMAGSQETARGAFVRMRIKFDEGLFGGAR
jgi:hypothetical protein